MLKKHFETCMLMSPKNIFILCHSTVHQVNIHIIRPNDRMTHARCKGGTSGQRGEWAQSTGNAFLMAEIKSLKILH